MSSYDKHLGFIVTESKTPFYQQAAAFAVGGVLNVRATLKFRAEGMETDGIVQMQS